MMTARLDCGFNLMKFLDIALNLTNLKKDFMFSRLLQIALINLSLGLTAMADTRVCSYVARLSERDHSASDGFRLKDAASIIRQDRANFHKFSRRDEEDETDSFFASVRNREDLENMVKRRQLPSAVSAAIVRGTPLVEIEVIQSDAGYRYIRVTLL